MALSKEELLKPRYKVIADYPNSDFEVGDIIEMEGKSDWYTGKQDWYSKPCGGRNGTVAMKSIKVFEPYPHLFKKMEWWEERGVSEMPKYVKFKSKFVVEVSRFGTGTDSKKMYAVFDYKGKCMARPLKNLLPSDETEYNQYIQKQSTNG